MSLKTHTKNMLFIFVVVIVVVVFTTLIMIVIIRRSFCGSCDRYVCLPWKALDYKVKDIRFNKLKTIKVT